MTKSESVPALLLHWYDRNKRDLPWRHTYDPYHVWISEIMLQQTQMERGVQYFLRWIARFPDVTSVADAGEQEIMKLWEGLGYYARARNLHKAAQMMVADFQGALPGNHQHLLTLPGVGPYTAAAIASIAYNHDVPLVDANVERLFARLFDIDSPVKEKAALTRIHALAKEMLPAGQARDYNQALMEFGALVCTPKNPDCASCPLAVHCLAFQRETVQQRPIVAVKQKSVTIEMVTGVLRDEGKLFIQQRLADDIWGGLWEFPGGRLEEGETPEEALKREYREETEWTIAVGEKITCVVHHYMKYKVILHCFVCHCEQPIPAPVLHAAQSACWVTPSELANFAFPAGHRKCIDSVLKNCPELFLKGTPVSRK